MNGGCGKGSNPRPLSVSRDEFRRRWDETFRRWFDEADEAHKIVEQEKAAMEAAFDGHPEKAKAPGVGFRIIGSSCLKPGEWALVGNDLALFAPPYDR